MIYGVREEWLKFSKSCINFLEEHCVSHDADGRLYFTVEADGTPLRQRRYCYTEAFYCIANAEYYGITGEREHLERARRAYDMYWNLNHGMPDPTGMGPKSTRPGRGLELKGFNAFKLELAQHTAPEKLRVQVSTDLDTTEGRCQEVSRLAHEAVQQTVELFQPQQIVAAVEQIEKASRIMCIGSGSSMILASECANLFSTVTGKFFAVADTHTQISTLATMGINDIIFLFSYSGATTGGVSILELAKSRGIQCILVTRFSKSPAAKLSDIMLRCGSKSVLRWQKCISENIPQPFLPFSADVAVGL